MQKINFNDRYGLTQAVIEGWKTNTRRPINSMPKDCAAVHKNCWGADWSDKPMSLVVDRDTGGIYCEYCGNGANWYDGSYFYKTRYKVGEVVAVAQRYSTIAAGHPDVYTFLLQVAKAHKISLESVQDLAGWNNKMFTKAELMPHQIRITGIKCERLQDISDADCIKEGIFVNEYVGNGKKCHHYGFDGFFDETAGWFARGWYNTPREAFATLIDKVSGRGTWDLNLLAAAYEFELVK